MTTRRATLIVQPGTGWAVRLAADPQRITKRSVFVATFVILTFVGGVALAYLGSWAIKALGTLVALSGLAWVTAAVRLARSRTVAPGDWRYQGQRIEGDGRTLLAEAVLRATQVEHLLAELPTALDWQRFRPQVEGVLWDAAGHAAEATKLDLEASRCEPGEADHLLDARREHLVVVARARDEVVELLAVARRKAAEIDPASVSQPEEQAPRVRRSRPLNGRRREG